MEQYKILNDQKLRLECERDQGVERREALVLQCAELEKMPLPAPLRKDRVEEARRILREQSISFLPFYEAVDFSGDLSQEERNQLEGQLTASGLLDGLVVSEKDREKAKEVLCSLSDTLLSAKGEKTEKYPFLVSVSEDPGIRGASDEILESIFLENTEGAEVILEKNGYFRNGILEGYCHSTEEASYVRAEARKRKLKRLIQEKREEIAKEEERVSVCETKLGILKGRLDQLCREKEELPSFSDLNQAIDILKTSREELGRAENGLEEQERRTAQKRDEHKKQEQAVIKACRPLPYYRTIEAYEEVKGSLEAYQKQILQLERTISQWEGIKAEKEHTQELIQRSEEIIDTGYGYLNGFVRTMKEAEIEIHRLEEYLDHPEIKAMTQRMGEIKEALKEKSCQYHETDKRIAVLEQEQRLRQEKRQQEQKTGQQDQKTGQQDQKAGQGIRLAVLGARVTKNPHEFDRDTLGGKLLIQALSCVHEGMACKSAEDILMLYYASGIKPDDISSFATAYGIHLYTEEGEHPAYRGFLEMGEPFVITLSNLGRIKSAQARSNKVYAVENQMVFSHLCESLKGKEVPLICTSGQVKTASWMLMDLLWENGNTIYYCGDLDPEGIGIAEKILWRAGKSACLWHMSGDDYRLSMSEEPISAESLSKLEKVSHPALAEVKAEALNQKKAGYQEQLMELMLEDMNGRKETVNEVG